MGMQHGLGVVAQAFLERAPAMVLSEAEKAARAKAEKEAWGLEFLLLFKPVCSFPPRFAHSFWVRGGISSCHVTVRCGRP